jgi:nitrogen fixation/metabolism regulation signal transduction histidine kinase
VELLDVAAPALTAEMTANIEEMDRMVGQFLHYVRANYHESPTRAALDDVVRQTLAIYATDDRLHLNSTRQRRVGSRELHSSYTLNLVQNALDYGEPPVTVHTSLTALRFRSSVRRLRGGTIRGGVE